MTRGLEPEALKASSSAHGGVAVTWKDEFALAAMLRRRGPSEHRRAGVGAMLATTPETIAWGHIPTERTPVLRIDPGDTVSVQTLSHQGLVNDEDPVAFLGSLGVAAEDVLPEVSGIHATCPRPPGASSHLLTGPIAIAGAEPGDSLEVHILAAELRVDYGINVSGPGRGLLPDLLDTTDLRLLRRDASGERLVFSQDISVPIAPFPGFVGLAPHPDAGPVGSRTPGAWGGNLDLRLLTAGSSIILPVSRPGGQLYLGDPHSAQGHGEVNGTAVEHSATFVISTELHKGRSVRSPLVLTPSHIILTAVGQDAQSALKDALRTAIDFICGWTDGALDRGDAYALCSIAADVGLAEVVNGADVAYVSIPRDVLPDAR